MTPGSDDNPAERPVICFADVCLMDAVKEVRLSGQVREGHVMVNTDALVQANVDYASEVRVYRRPDVSRPDAPDESSREFTGRVVRATPDGSLTRLDLASMAELRRPFAGQWTFAAGMPASEMVWTLARESGIPEDRLDIFEFQRRQEMFEVAAPIDGLSIEKPFLTTGVTFTDEARIAGLVERFETSDVRDEFVSAEAWAVVILGAGTVWEAERLAVSRIELALAVLTLRLRFSGAQLDGQPREFDTEVSRVEPRLRELIAVRSLSGRRHWLRYIGPGSTSTRAPVGQAVETRRPVLGRGVSEQVREAIRAWHRAATTREPATALSALWEAIEFYVAGTTLPPTFRPADLKALRRSAVAVLGEDQMRRYDQLLGMGNKHSLMPLLKERLRLDRVPHTASELRVLSSTRDIRNDFVHGRGPAAVGDEDLAIALALVNRMLAYRLARLSARAG